jgi:hypothetical protein
MGEPVENQAEYAMGEGERPIDYVARIKKALGETGSVTTLEAIQRGIQQNASAFAPGEHEAAMRAVKKRRKQLSASSDAGTTFA